MVYSHRPAREGIFYAIAAIRDGAAPISSASMTEHPMRILLSAIFLSLSAGAVGAESVTGPVIEDYGPVYYVPDEPLALPPGARMKALFDIAAVPEEPGKLNHRLETVARYLNMHAQAGVDPDRLDTAVVFHGRATRTALGPEAFEARYGEPHPDAELIRQLAAAGVQFLVCGQSAAGYGFRPDELAPDVEVSLSALTVLVRLQGEGFALVPWGTD
jgi:intracellular sulfur oxidation DsrE/DsrF family protein